MREELLQELENEYAQLRADHEREEAARKEKIRVEQPDIYSLMMQREQLVFGTLKEIMNGTAQTENLPEKMEQLSNEIRNRLTRTGYPPDYLAPIYRCPLCKDTGRTGELLKEPCDCLKKELQGKLRKRIGLRSEKRESFETFDLRLFPDTVLPGRSFTQRTQMRLIRDDCRQWAESYPDTPVQDLLLTGKSGMGKTFLLRAMAERLIERDVNVLIISAYKLIELARQAYFDKGELAGEITGAQVLMIDDLGSEPLMQNITVEQLFQLLNERRNRGLSTIFSTNLTMNEIRTRYTERIASRLQDQKVCRVISLEGKDIRS